jgi:hypothetical protein
MGVMLKHPSHDRVHSKRECAEFGQATGPLMDRLASLRPAGTLREWTVPRPV